MPLDSRTRFRKSLESVKVDTVSSLSYRANAGLLRPHTMVKKRKVVTTSIVIQ